ncbi:hypothetical protein ACN42_g1976 [Penicillium freii]|uniref:Uncharacterized protein n=1 Tax=Penicillium freii TaxID=48697 RepID=A0A117NR86_PENFR|nr:hypothetical protein ACN42_g1976 [Penicillium freii]
MTPTTTNTLSSTRRNLNNGIGRPRNISITTLINSKIIPTGTSAVRRAINDQLRTGTDKGNLILSVYPLAERLACTIAIYARIWPWLLVEAPWPCLASNTTK